MPHIEHEVEEDGEGNWLISYADMMTLLWGFFVIYSAMSTPDSVKFEKLKQSTLQAMGVEYTKPFAKLALDLKKVFDEANLGGNVIIEESTEGLVITVSAVSFFESGSATLTKPAENLLAKLAVELKPSSEKFRITIEGHTDDVPISTERFPSNWDLSSVRASAVVRLFEKEGIPHPNLRAIGYADLLPVVPVEGSDKSKLQTIREANRRVVIRIEQKLQ
jgi:chemotaxis protein MotB